MRLFFKRMNRTMHMILDSESMEVLNEIFAITIFMASIIVIVIMPIFLLYPYIGALSTTWVIFVIILSSIIENRIFLIEWFRWQFIEPFKKNKQG